MHERDPHSRSVVRSRTVFVLRVLLLVLAVGAALGGLGASRDLAAPTGRYVCPMHAEVTSATPGKCPICGMSLEPTVTGAPSAIKPSSYLTYDVARRRAYGPDALAPAWVDEDGSVCALLYVDELAARGPDEHATFFPASAPADGVQVKATPDPPLAWDRSTARMRFRLDGAATTLHSGEVGWLRRPRSPEPPVIPSSAVLEEAAGPYVLVASSDGRTLAKRPVEVGRVFGGLAAIVSGLHPTDRVLAGSAFFVDAERRLRAETAIDVASR